MRSLLVVILLSLLTACSKTPERYFSHAGLKAQLASQTEGLDYAAHWVSKDTLLLPADTSEAKVILIYMARGRNQSEEQDNAQMQLSPSPMPDWVAKRYPHLKHWRAFHLDKPVRHVRAMLKGENLVVRLDEAGNILGASGVQLPGVVDELYTSGANDADELADYGAIVQDDHVSIRLWAPLARKVSLLLFDNQLNQLQRLALSPQTATGVWQGRTKLNSIGLYYQYELEQVMPHSGKLETFVVTDPYSLSLSANSTHSQIVDMSGAGTTPKGWSSQARPALDYPEQHIIYETHIGDFSGTDTSLKDPQWRGKYLAFTDTNSAPVKHIKALGQAGLNTIHLLPSYDLGSIDEVTGLGINDSLARYCARLPDLPQCQGDTNMPLAKVLAELDPMSGDAQALVSAVRGIDDYNWGYDPFHYNVPEGSYATDPMGETRIYEFRQMVMALHSMGFRVVMDVVYNHTFQAGMAPKAVLDKVVPGYYHRLDPNSGAIAQSTCCDNTATEHAMMAKLMVDSLVIWAREYKIDGFRFDLMGHQPKALMLQAREAIRDIDPDTYFYGEGWNFGEVANNQRFVQATQNELAGSEIGTFSDRLRDAVRGGSSFDFKEAIRKGQGLANGLYTSPNELYASAEDARASFDLALRQAKLGLAANLADFRFSHNGQPQRGDEVPYGGGIAGYAKDPADIINYVSKHDNQTLWDNNQYRIAFHHGADDRVRMQLLALAFPAYAQGIPFFHMGSELLRSKSFLRDSYDYGHWFNAVDFSQHTNNYHVGLPPREKDQDNWPLIRHIINNNEGRDRVTAEHIRFASAAFMDMLRIRSQSPLFSLKHASAIQQRVSFLDGPIDTLVMSIDDGYLTPSLNDLDPQVSQLLVIFNFAPGGRKVSVMDAKGLMLHPVLQSGADTVVKATRMGAEAIEVPGLSVVVLVRP